MRTNRLLAVVVVLQGLLLAGQWLGNGTASPAILATAQAQPDPNRDRWLMIDELKALNAKMDKLVGILESGNLQVRASSPDEKGNGARGR
jgi:hypothetical protein